MAERRFVFNCPLDFSGLGPVHDGRVSHALHFRILSGCHKFSLSAHKSVNCSPYKPTVKPRPQLRKILVSVAKILLTIFPVNAGKVEARYASGDLDEARYLALERITTRTKGSNNDFLHSTLRSHYRPFCEEEDFSVSDKEPLAQGVCKCLRLARGW
jgi:hypothetical protein